MKKEEILDKARIMIIDDAEENCEIIEEELREYGYKNLKSVKTKKEAIKLASEEPYDLLIIDMRLDNEKEGGLEIIRKLKSICSVTIVLTANATVRNCRDCFKNGVFDYIDKIGFKDSYDELLRSIKYGLEELVKWGNSEDAHWLMENRDKLMENENYRGNYVAAYNGKIMAVGKNGKELQEKIDETGLIFLVGPAITKIPKELVNLL